MGTQETMELIYSLAGFPNETEWIEFKESNSEPTRIARDISALANSAAYLGKEYAYKIWGLDDETHRLVGTGFRYLKAYGKGSQALSIWLRNALSRNANYEFLSCDFNSMHFEVLRIRAASMQPVFYDKDAYIREGSSSCRLEPGSAKEAELWRRLQREGYELRVALEDLTEHDVAEHLDLDVYYHLLRLRRPHEMADMLRPLVEQRLIKQQDNGRYAITNLGALLVGKRLSSFLGLSRRVLRVVRHEGRGNFKILEDRHFDCGYALALPEAQEFIMSSIPSSEVLDGAFRRIEYSYPEAAVRELLSNVVMHQDLSDTTAGPTVGIYENRIEFSNPGIPLVPIERLLNARPRTRNPLLVDIMRQMDLCEEDGTGWDIAVDACESANLPAPQAECDEDLGTKVTLFCGRAFQRMTKAERMNAVYWHACLLYAQGESMSNQTLRERFGLDGSRKNVVAVSRLIRECVDRELVREEDEDASDKFRRYIPYWG
jgi:predicted HTH transcriptional regulator